MESSGRGDFEEFADDFADRTRQLKSLILLHSARPDEATHEVPPRERMGAERVAHAQLPTATKPCTLCFKINTSIDALRLMIMHAVS